jgi:(S)-2-hydroxyglutarate dehydrogenase
VGGGIVGLAVARELLARRPSASICVLEREDEIAAHQSSHNSGVIHAGVYYAPGSLKARLCVEGARAMYEYCEQHQIPVQRSGKVILATDSSELARLEELRRRALLNGVHGIRTLDAAGIEELEPHARGIAGLHSPDTGVVDFTRVARAFARDILDCGGLVAGGCKVTGVKLAARSLRLTHARGVTETRHAVFCAGAWADRLALSAGADPDPRIVPFRGAYLRLVPQRRELVRSLIYPVPDPTLPFLGVHLTRGIDGEVLLGPTALLAGARDGYRLGALRPLDVLETVRWPGTWRMLARWWRTGAQEIRHAVLRSSLVRSAARYLPELNAGDVEPAFAGIRAQALARNGVLVDDFVFSHTERALHVRNAPSPGATSSLAIARHVVDEAERTLDLPRPS